MPSYILTIAYTVENTTAHTALIDAVVDALNNAPSELALSQATVVDDTGVVEDLLGPESDTSNSVSPTDIGNGGNTADAPAVPTDPSGPEPASESIPSGKEF